MLQVLDGSRDQFRLITILPFNSEESNPAQVKCHLETFSLTDEAFTPAYKNYLLDNNLPNSWDSFQASPRDEIDLSDWIYLRHPDDNATTNLPEFRYEWGDFLALSYTWGDPTDVCEILVNGRPLAITRNLEACLRVLREKEYVKRGWKLWVDAICINQNDIVERASQVTRMREIYTKAWTPIIWIGDETEDSSFGLDLIETLATEFTSRDGINQLTRLLHQNPQHFGRGRWRALNNVVCRPYWRRLWILQEVTLGRHSTPVLCGNRTIPWAHFAQAFKIIINTDEVINRYITGELEMASIPLDLVIWSNLGTVSEIEEFQNLHTKGKRPNMYRLLQFSRGALTTNPRDKIYGLLALMDQSVASLIKPNYADKVENIYCSFMLDTIKATGSLELIRHCELDRNSVLPSWAPNWLIGANKCVLTNSDNAFTTSGSSNASIRILAGSQSILCRGYIIDHFDGMGCLWKDRWSPESITQSTGKATYYNTLEDIREAIWKSMVACHRLPDKPLDADYSSLLGTLALSAMKLPDHSPIKDLVGSNIFDWCVKFLKGNATLQVAGRPMEEYYLKDIEPARVDVVHLRDALMQRDRINLNRKLVTTEKGLIGMALETVERTDFVAILLGCSTPMVLRRAPSDTTQTRWRVVGEMYLHGIMNGEAMNWGLPLQDIELC